MENDQVKQETTKMEKTREHPSKSGLLDLL